MTMTNKEAKKELSKLIFELGFEDDVDDRVCALTMAIQALSQEPTVQDKQAESEKYQKAFDDGYENGYAQARFDYEQEPTDAISRDAVNNLQKYRYNCGDTSITGVSLKSINELPPVTPQQKSGHWIHFAQSDDCSECGWSTGKYISPSKYCPNCGAKMVEPQERSE
jgi:hypothetical protein